MLSRKAQSALWENLSFCDVEFRTILFASSLLVSSLLVSSSTNFTMLELSANLVTKRFGERMVIRDMSFVLHASTAATTTNTGNVVGITGNVVGITGNNGAGKSTLVKMIAGVLAPTSGSITCLQDGNQFNAATFQHAIGFVAPYLTLYEEFTPRELMRLVGDIRGRGDKHDAHRGDNHGTARTEELLRLVRLWERRDDEIRGFSSGMKQRMKYALALLHSPPILILDEPMTNLDSDGIAIVEGIIQQHSATGLAILATNDARDLALCGRTIAVGATASRS
jgi:heme exporter protein A